MREPCTSSDHITDKRANEIKRVLAPELRKCIKKIGKAACIDRPHDCDFCTVEVVHVLSLEMMVYVITRMYGFTSEESEDYMRYIVRTMYEDIASYRNGANQEGLSITPSDN